MHLTQFPRNSLELGVSLEDVVGKGCEMSIYHTNSGVEDLKPCSDAAFVPSAL